jgi:hypothetical protein
VAEGFGEVFGVGGGVVRDKGGLSFWGGAGGTGGGVRFTADSGLDGRGKARSPTVSSIFSGFCYREKVKSLGICGFFGR